MFYPIDCNAEKKKEISEQLQLYKNLITSPIQQGSNTPNLDTNKDTNNSQQNNEENRPKNIPKENSKVRKQPSSSSLTPEQQASGPYRSAVKAAFQYRKKLKESAMINDE